MQVILTESEWEAVQKTQYDLDSWSGFLDTFTGDAALHTELVEKLTTTKDTAGNILWDMYSRFTSTKKNEPVL